MGQAPSNPSGSAPLSATSFSQPAPGGADASSCPVDKNARETWLKAAKSQQPSQTTKESSSSLTPKDALPEGHPAVPVTPETASACPVDPKAREAWMRAASGVQGQQSRSETPQNGVVVDGEEAAAFASSAQFRPKFANSRLSSHREVSTIPRALPHPLPTAPRTSDTKSSRSSAPTSAHGILAPSPNAQTPSATDIHTSPTGHWVYPSEEMFFNAMLRKNYSPKTRDMSSIVPLHNAVNERTWLEILAWEAGQGSEKCGGPRLVSFKGDASKLTPRARARALLGYRKPFDRHDWVVERCEGERVEYVIDFYEGKKRQQEQEQKTAATAAGAAPRGKVAAEPVSFYLDVRPKLNTWEGCRLRFAKYWGWS